MLKRIDVAELLGAAFVLLLGALVIFIASDYPMGTLNRMGTGYFPMILGVLLLIVGAVLLLEVFTVERETRAPFPFRPMVMVSLGIMAFACLVETLGLVAATVALVAVSSLAESPLRPVTTLIIAVAMSIIGVLVFIKGLGLPLSAFGG